MMWREKKIAQAQTVRLAKSLKIDFGWAEESDDADDLSSRGFK